MCFVNNTQNGPSVTRKKVANLIHGEGQQNSYILLNAYFQNVAVDVPKKKYQ